MIHSHSASWSKELAEGLIGWEQEQHYEMINQSVTYQLSSLKLIYQVDMHLDKILSNT